MTMTLSERRERATARFGWVSEQAGVVLCGGCLLDLRTRAANASLPDKLWLLKDTWTPFDDADEWCSGCDVDLKPRRGAV